MITMLETKIACEALGHIVFKNLRQHPNLNILQEVYGNCAPRMMKALVYEMTVHKLEIDAYLVSDSKPMSRLEYAQLREDLLEACRQLDAVGFLP